MLPQAFGDFDPQPAGIVAERRVEQRDADVALERTGATLAGPPVFSDDFVLLERRISSLLLPPEGR